MGWFLYDCCCQTCDSQFCLVHGRSHVGCSEEVGELYLAGSVGNLSSADPECCALPTNGLVYSTGCLWTLTENGCDWELEIDGANTEFRQIIDATHTIIWIPVGNFNPLCVSLMEVDYAQSTIPDDCSYYRYLCISPFNGCCEAEGERSVGIPDDLFGRLTYCFGSSGNLTVDFTLSWDNTTGTWEASVTVSGNTLTLSLECVCGGFNTGCGTAGGNECYELTWTYDGCGGGLGDTEVWGSCSCDPFDLVFTLPNVDASCCAAEVAQTWTIEISEEEIV